MSETVTQGKSMDVALEETIGSIKNAKTDRKTARERTG